MPPQFETSFTKIRYMILEKWKIRAGISIAVALLISELLFITSGYKFRMNWFVLAILLYLTITFGFSLYLRYRMHKEIMQESDEELLDNIED